MISFNYVNTPSILTVIISTYINNRRFIYYVFSILSRNILVKNVTKTIKCNSILQKALISFGNGLQKNMVVQAIKYRPGETVDDKNARLNRPLTPHLTIYRPQLTSILSILHRIAGNYQITDNYPSIITIFF